MELVGVGRTLNTTAPDLVGRGYGLAVDESTPLFPRITISEEEAEERWLMMTITAGALIMFKNDFIGFAAGCAYWGLLCVQEKLPAWRARLRGGT